MKDTHMRLVNLYALFSSHLAHCYAVGGHHKFRHAHTDSHVRYIVLDVIKALTISLQVCCYYMFNSIEVITSYQEHVHFPLHPIQELNVLGMLDFRSKLWMALDEKHRAISDLNLALEYVQHSPSLSLSLSHLFNLLLLGVVHQMKDCCEGRTYTTISRTTHGYILPSPSP